MIDSLVIRAPTDLRRVAELQEALDAGESEAIAPALEVGAGSVLIDEAAGRAVAERLGLVPFNLMGILLRARALGLVPEVRPLVESLRDEAGFFLSGRLRDDILRRAGE